MKDGENYSGVQTPASKVKSGVGRGMRRKGIPEREKETKERGGLN